MAHIEDINNIPKEKFQFATGKDFTHDTKFDTKPVGYFQDAFRRFCKNKGAVVAAIIIAIMVLFAIIVPFITQYEADYSDSVFTYTYPKLKIFENSGFWDGGKDTEKSKKDFVYYYAMGFETGYDAVMNRQFTESNGIIKFRLDTYHSNGMIFKNFTLEEYQAIQKYQDETGKQVIYPAVDTTKVKLGFEFEDDANIYYETQIAGNNKTTIIYDENYMVKPAYKKYNSGVVHDDQYTSKRIAGDDGSYAYATITSSGFRCRVNYYEYFIYNHTVILNDGITEPYFVFGTTGAGKDILTCLSSGARFSFIFAIIVAIVNMFVGAIYGSIEGYYGGKVDLIMERISDILAAIPFMIVITLLKLHMGQSSQVLILFISFFLTGWIGMAGTTRMQFYRFKNQEYVLAARTLGATDRRLMFKHIFPNAIGTLVTSCALVIPSMIYSETNLSYLGIINLETGKITSVGTLIAAGQKALATDPFVALFPTIFLALLMLTFNLFGNGLRDAFNPSLRGSEG